MDILACTISNISDHFQPLKDTIPKHLLPTLTGQNSFSDSIRDVFALPAHLGGLGIINSVQHATNQHSTSREVTAPLVNLVIDQLVVFPLAAREDLHQAKRIAQ